MAEPSIAEILEETTERCRNLDAPLAGRLRAFADEVRVLDADFADTVERMIDRLRASGAGERAPVPGEPMPDFMLPDQNGKLVSLARPNRAWASRRCLPSRSLVSILPNNRRCPGAHPWGGTGARRRTRRHHSGNRAFQQRAAIDCKRTLPVLSDMDNGYALMLNLAFYVGDEKKRKMKCAGWDITPYNANDNWTLPIPATFVVGADGLIVARHIDPDYRKRMDVDAILDAVAPRAAEPRLGGFRAGFALRPVCARSILINMLAAIDR